MALNDLFHISSIREDITYEIYVQMVEIYNEIVRDLLAQDATNSKYPFEFHPKFTSVTFFFFCPFVD